jgi:hypothetical protein
MIAGIIVGIILLLTKDKKDQGNIQEEEGPKKKKGNFDDKENMFDQPNKTM